MFERMRAEKNMEKNIPGPFGGTHVKLLMREANQESMRSVAHMAQFLAGLVRSVDMRMLGLSIYDVPVELAKLEIQPFEDEGGITGVGVLSTSHAACHTWPERRSGVIDVYSCREFNIDKVVEFVSEFWEVDMKNIQVTDLSRSLAWQDFSHRV